MKKALLFLVQLILFAALFALTPVFALFDPLHLKPWFLSHPTPVSTRYFSPEGLLLMILLYLVILAVEAARKRIRTSGILTTIAFVLVLAFGIWSRWGWWNNS
jgi:hypothetical protein